MRFVLNGADIMYACAMLQYDVTSHTRQTVRAVKNKTLMENRYDGINSLLVKKNISIPRASFGKRYDTPECR